MEKYDNNRDGRIDRNEQNKASRRIINEYKRKFKALRPTPKGNLRRGVNTKRKDIMKRMETLKKYKKSLSACSENPRGKGCVNINYVYEYDYGLLDIIRWLFLLILLIKF